MPEAAAIQTAVSVRRCDDSDARAWDAYVARQPDASFFHRFGWQRVIRDAFGHRAYFLVAQRDGVINGILPLVHLRSLLFGNSLISMPFCVYGGIVADDDDVREALRREGMSVARELGVDCLELRHRQRQFADWPAKDLYVTFRKEIADNDEENLMAIPRKQRAMIRKAQKTGLVSEVSDDLDTFYAMYSESVRNLGTPVFSRRYFDILREEFGDEVELLVVREQSTAVAAVMSFYHRDEVLPYYGGGTTRARATKANDFMYWELMRLATSRGIRVFDYGRSKQGTGSYRFKKHWGFTPEPLHYEFGLVNAAEMPDISPANPRYRMFIAAWKRLPLPVSRILGPMLARDLG
ncbi:MAG: FemAB family PEP-CTERM system-associated protein [Gammaproteobacteria bacterium]|nr:FemAB family PEP-CTERM system-associated protein [Gammaproteobacteria bacterium]